MIGQLLKGALMVAAAENARRAARRAMFMMVAMIFVAIGAGFLIAAAWQALALVTSPLSATLIVGGANLVIGLLFVVIANSGSTRGSAGHRFAETAERELAAVQEGLKGISPLLPVVGAVALGFLLTGRRR